ncbi:matrixin family metalloprotease [Candidatus Acetothermia bacterium]|nr:matrixin family metalloprotease [Candidatus Acetothermia bacterium]MBI3459774.1 matrixin family metalloprotease [Candidatus Acetothermia bacterium]
MNTRHFYTRTKFPFVLGLLALLDFLAGGCTTATFSPQSESNHFMDVTDIENPVTGLRTATFTDWHETSPETTPLARVRNNGPCAESKAYKLYAGGVHWQEMPVTYRLDSSVTNQAWKNAIRQAFATWSAAVTSLSFREDENSSNIVSWGTIDGPGRALAQTSFTYQGTQMVSFSILFDASESWGILGADICPTVQGKTIDIQDIATHEIGHALGLGHTGSRKDRALTMYPSAQPGETLKRSLGAGDKAGVAALYGP